MHVGNCVVKGLEYVHEELLEYFQFYFNIMLEEKTKRAGRKKRATAIGVRSGEYLTDDPDYAAYAQILFDGSWTLPRLQLQVSPFVGCIVFHCTRLADVCQGNHVQVRK